MNSLPELDCAEGRLLQIETAAMMKIIPLQDPLPATPSPTPRPHPPSPQSQKTPKLEEPTRQFIAKCCVKLTQGYHSANADITFLASLPLNGTFLEIMNSMQKDLQYELKNLSTANHDKGAYFSRHLNKAIQKGYDIKMDRTPTVKISTDAPVMFMGDNNVTKVLKFIQQRGYQDFIQFNAHVTVHDPCGLSEDISKDSSLMSESGSEFGKIHPKDLCHTRLH